jgi:hypothetical protein
MTHQEAMKIAAKAWGRVKDSQDPVFELCEENHRFNLAYKVENVAKNGGASDDFEREVLRILGKLNVSDPRESAFAALHLLPSAPAALVRAAYKCLAAIHHPDKGGDEGVMKHVNAAYKQLSN